jgi:hypothetical protein
MNERFALASQTVVTTFGKPQVAMSAHGVAPPHPGSVPLSVNVASLALKRQAPAGRYTPLIAFPEIVDLVTLTGARMSPFTP